VTRECPDSERTRKGAAFPQQALRGKRRRGRKSVAGVGEFRSKTGIGAGEQKKNKKGGVRSSGQGSRSETLVKERFVGTRKEEKGACWSTYWGKYYNIHHNVETEITGREAAGSDHRGASAGVPRRQKETSHKRKMGEHVLEMKVPTIRDTCQPGWPRPRPS